MSESVTTTIIKLLKNFKFVYEALKSDFIFTDDFNLCLYLNSRQT